MNRLKQFACFSLVFGGVLGGSGAAMAAPNAASPDSYGDRNIGHFGDPNQGYFGNTDSGNFLDAYFDPIRGKYESREPANTRGARPYVVLKQPVADPMPAHGAR